MKITAFALALASILPAAASAQGTTTADANSQSGANSQVILEGSSYQRHAPGLGGVGSNSTAPCVVGYGGGLVIPGGGIQIGNGKIDKNCEVRTEAAMLRDLLNMQTSPGKTAAILHACKNSDRMSETLGAMGHCPQAAPAKTSRTQTIQQTQRVVCPEGSTWDGKGCYARNLRDVRR